MTATLVKAKKGRSTQGELTPNTSEKTGTISPAKVAAMRDFESAQDGDREALARLVAMMDAEKAAQGHSAMEAALIAACGGENLNAARSVTEALYGENLLKAEGARRSMAQLAVSLASTNPSKAELLCCEHVAVCWFWVQHLEGMSAQVMRGEARTIMMPFFEKRLESASRRYLAALKTLAQVQRLNLPPVSVTFAQINTPQSTTPEHISGALPTGRL